jgi:hypothetical protein
MANRIALRILIFATATAGGMAFGVAVMAIYTGQYWLAALDAAFGIFNIWFWYVNLAALKRLR